ncbi:helicase/secretion neighborhood TadE-like protein [Sinosporangium album]|uniref:Helicase/secretion neighborhood TadE-like protein n=1 Tax=Sinosporangium album TaxID=504805 RepID=A0A1G7U5P4_9ACTN|nr:Rv3654c family TadE-like protein [Sinosporangium album]SDG42379.1 helicase/secretion neighborhood TadE-like protein [Sinosporangium album]
MMSGEQTKALSRLERGSVTVWALTVIALIMLVTYAVVVVGMVRVARHRAQAAADLSALNAARVLLADHAHACREATTLAHANGAVLQRCDVTDETVDVRVAIRTTLPLRGVGLHVITARARAGPAEASRALPTPQ